MLIPALTVRRILLLGLMLASLVVLTDNVARNELENAMGDLAFAMPGMAGGSR